MKRFAFYFLAIPVSLIFFGCVTATPISRIVENPQAYSGKTVLIDGEVLQVINIPLVDSSLFLFGDDQWSVPVVSSTPHEKGELYRLSGRVMAFPENDSKEASREAVWAIADFLVEQDIVDEKKAEKTGEAVLKGLYRLSEELGRVFFVIEEDAPRH
ncbi:MAG: hypothetical protein JW760_01240 [Spirochaetales bacterium]|nr:hypothetical protein [Spirochaetales bacterium]